MLNQNDVEKIVRSIGEDMAMWFVKLPILFVIICTSCGSMGGMVGIMLALITK